MTETVKEIVTVESDLVLVKAQVMIRDDNKGGWVPMKGGGLSNVSVRRRITTSEEEQSQLEFIIFGQRISDNSEVLSCAIKKDFQYHKVMPTFHHWKTGEKKFGLTFQTAREARAFDAGLRKAVDELVDGISDSSSALNNPDDEVAEDGIFMRRLRGRKRKEKRLSQKKTLNLPSDQGDSRSSSDSSIRGSEPTTPTQEKNPPRSHYDGSDQDSPSVNAERHPHLREYFYQNVEGSRVPQHDLSKSLKKREKYPPFGRKPPKKQKRRGCRKRCRYCQKYFYEDENSRGSCEYAPDCMRTALDEVSCIRCTRCICYHCMADEEGDFEQHPCECGSDDDGCGRKWLGLSLLSILIPCLCLYPPLRACHWCGVRCGLCGGRHRPTS